jgi:hypothetical protein
MRRPSIEKHGHLALSSLNHAEGMGCMELERTSSNGGVVDDGRPPSKVFGDLKTIASVIKTIHILPAQASVLERFPAASTCIMSGVTPGPTARDGCS